MQDALPDQGMQDALPDHSHYKSIETNQIWLRFWKKKNQWLFIDFPQREIEIATYGMSLPL